MQKEVATWFRLIGDALRQFTALMLFVVLAVIVSDLYTYGYASHFLELRIVLAHAVPTLWILGGAALAVLLLNIVVEAVRPLNEWTIFSRIIKNGMYVGLGSYDDPWRILIFIITAYLLVPAVTGRIIAMTKTTYQVVKLTEPTRSINEAIIVSPTVNGVLLGLYDRTRNAVLDRETLVDTLGPSEPRFSQTERLGRVARSH
jgi:hypothetical protein